jgi:hypothetical protein
MKQIGKITLKKIPKSELKKLPEDEKPATHIIRHGEKLIDDDEEIPIEEVIDRYFDE